MVDCATDAETEVGQYANYADCFSHCIESKNNVFCGFFCSGQFPTKSHSEAAEEQVGEWVAAKNFKYPGTVKYTPENAHVEYREKNWRGKFTAYYKWACNDGFKNTRGSQQVNLKVFGLGTVMDRARSGLMWVGSDGDA